MATQRSTQISLIGLATGLPWLAVTPAALAQLEVTGGGVTFNEVNLFVPTDGEVTGTLPLTTIPATSPDNRTVIYDGTFDPTTLVIETNQGNIPADAIFRSTTLPVIEDLTGDLNAASDLVGVTGSLGGTLSFRSVGPAGASFFNIPTTLEFQVEGVEATSLAPTAFTEFRSEGWILTETGFVTDVDGFGVVQRQQPVFLVQYQQNGVDGAIAEDQIVLGNYVPATAYAAERAGNSYDLDALDLGFTGGDIFTPPGFSLEGAEPEVDAGIIVTSAVRSTARVDAISVFTDVAIINLPNPPESEFAGVTLNPGFTQFRPALPSFVLVGVFVFSNVPSGRWVDPPMADGFEYEMTPRDVPIGVASRVFPGMTGVGQADDSVFTRISGFPTGVDEDDTFVVAVDGIMLGEFGPGDTLQFSDFAEVLGDRLENGGVRQFTISGIDPAVDANDPLAFPLRLDFNTPTASFEMRALETTAAAETEVSSTSLDP